MNEEQEVANSDNTPETPTNIEALPKVTEQDIQNEILQKSVVQEEEVEQSFDVSSLKLAQNVDNFVKSPTLSEMLPLNELFLKMTSSSSRLE